MKNILVLGLALILSGCFTAKQIVSTSLDFTCLNISTIDAKATEVLTSKNANATAFRVKDDALATIISACGQRPLDNNSAILKAAITAAANIAAIELGK